MYKFDSHINQQTFVVDEKLGIRKSHPEPIDFGLFPGISTIPQLFDRGLGISPKKPCLGQRPAPSRPYEWLNYTQVKSQVIQVANSLFCLLGEGQHAIGICSANTSKFMIVELACSLLGYVCVPIYATMGAGALKHIMMEARPKLVLCGTLELAKTIAALDVDCLTNLKSLVIVSSSMSVASSSSNESVKNAPSNSSSSQPDDFVEFKNQIQLKLESGASVLTYEGFLDLSSKLDNSTLPSQQIRPPPEEDGSKNDPLNLFTPSLVHFSYLPLAHIMEQILAVATLLVGGRIGYLTDGSINNLPGDLLAVRPTLFTTVPRVLAKFHANVMLKLSARPWLQRRFQSAVNSSLASLGDHKGRTKSNLIDFLLFRPLRAKFGGRIKAVICGSASATKEVMRFCRAVFACPIVYGYGLTESCGVVTISYMGDHLPVGHVGSLLPGFEARLADVDEWDYRVERDGIGEICIRSTCCTSGYYKQEELTRKLIDSDGWLHTGDLGSWSESGALQLVGRIKVAFKLSQGEYLSPDKAEQIYQLSPIISQALVDGKPELSYPAAVIVPDREALAELIHGHHGRHHHLFGHHSSSSGDGADKEPVDETKVIIKEIERIGRLNGLNGFELAKAVHLTDEAFTVENELLTPTLKINRVACRKHFAPVFSRLYQQLESM